MAGVERVGRALQKLPSLWPLRWPGPSANAASPLPNERDTPAMKSNRAASVDVDRFKETSGIGQDWAKTVYGSYYASSVPVYSAIRTRCEALARPPLVVMRQAPVQTGTSVDGRGPSGDPMHVLADRAPTLEPPSSNGSRPTATAAGPQHRGSWLPVGDAHPVQRLLDHANPWYSRGDLWRATETYLNLWGSVFWALERDGTGRWELWPIRPDRVRIVADRQKYIKGYVYFGLTGPVAYTADEMVWVRYFNPLEEYAGLSPMGPLRLSVDMGIDALKFNRNFFKNSALPDVIFTTEEAMNDEEVEDFYQRWDKRYRGTRERPQAGHRQLHQGHQDPGL